MSRDFRFFDFGKPRHQIWFSDDAQRRAKHVKVENETSVSEVRAAVRVSEDCGA